MAGFRVSRVHSDEAVLDCVRTSLALLEQLEPPEDLRPLVFQTVVQLVGMTALEQTPSGILPPTMALPGKL